MTKTIRHRLASGVLALMVGAACAGGGDTVVSGIGNSGNLINSPLSEQVARILVKSNQAPRIGDEELRTVFGAIRQRALDGELEAAMVLFRVASLQHEQND
jgi:hypothetical protein